MEPYYDFWRASNQDAAEAAIAIPTSLRRFECAVATGFNKQLAIRSVSFDGTAASALSGIVSAVPIFRLLHSSR